MRRNFHRVSISISLSIEAENSRVRADGDYANVRARRGIGKLSRVKIRGSLNPSRRSWNSNITGRLTYRRRFNDESRPLEIPSFCIDHFTGERAWKPKAAVPFFLSFVNFKLNAICIVPICTAIYHLGLRDREKTPIDRRRPTTVDNNGWILDLGVLKINRLFYKYPEVSRAHSYIHTNSHESLLTHPASCFW